jgi:chaperonin GroES
MAAALKRLLPLADRVLVQRVAAEAKTKGGIILPESNKKVNNATVVAVGPGTVNEKGEVIPCGIQVGDQVLLPEFGGTKVEVDSGVDMYLFREGDLLAKWES